MNLLSLLGSKTLVPLRRPRVFFWLALVALSPLAPASAAASRPDILLVTLDTTRADFLGCYGASPSRTPVLDRLATAGVRYTNAFSPVPLTLPAHASLFTGLEPASHGLRDNGWGKLAPGIPLLAETLREAGYRTAAFPAASVLDGRFGLDRGFDHYDDRLKAERIGQYGYPERPAREVVAAARAWLAATPADRPRFLWLHFYDPHAPYEPPAAGGTERERYAGEISEVDRALGELLEGWPVDRPRLIAAVADHGEGLGEHGEEGHGLLLYRSTLQVPLLIAGPGIPASTVVEEPVAIQRLAATLLAQAGVPSRLPGPLLPTKPGAPSPPAPIFHETLFPASAYGWSPLAAITTEAGRIIAAPRPEIYDFDDLAETRNRIDQPTSQQRRAQRQLADHLRRFPLDVAPPVVDPEIAAELRSLGYLSGQSRQVGKTDPKDGISLLGEMAQAEEMASRGEWAGARKIVEAVVAKSPQSVPFLAKLAELQARGGDPKAALLTLDRALALSPQLDFLHLSRGEHLLALQRRDEARRAFQLVLDLHPRSANAWLRLAEMALRDGQSAEEERLLRASLDAGTTSFVILARLGEICLRRGDLAAADDFLQRATHLEPNWPRLWQLWAEVARRQGQPAKALEREQRAKRPQ